MDELDLGLEETPDQQTINREQTRNKQLSEKVIQAQREKDEIAKAKEESDAKTTAALKEVEFYKNFSTVSSKYQAAAEYQDQIREKVNAGYDLEDAAVAVLNKEGKLTPSTEVKSKESPIGGSATTTMKGGGEKTLGEMSQEEKRAELLKTLS